MDAELERRYANVRAAMAAHGLDALVVSGSEYTGFEGAVTYLTGFQIVHRYAYVVVPGEGDPSVVFPSEARYVGEHATARIEQVFRDRPGEHIADRARGAPFDVEFDLARAVKSEAELESVRDSVRINERGFEIFLEHYAPGRTAAEVMAAAEEWFVAEGCGRLTMNMVLTGSDSAARPEFKIARRDEVLGELVLPSLEVAGPGMHWGHEAHARGIRRVLRSSPGLDAAGSELPRRPPCGLGRLRAARLPPRPRDWALDRHDDDRVPEDRRRRRDRARGEHGALDAPACDRGRRR
ncbi:MAG: hypothetical protein E6G28_05795 [Actinobacteria bacterium]|nr:MAG: hypothetical protein E6G28_05795 [Actinomycetota bacterium]